MGVWPGWTNRGSRYPLMRASVTYRTTLEWSCRVTAGRVRARPAGILGEAA